MLLESILSNSSLLLASGSSIFLLKKHSNQYSTLQPFFISASVGILGFCVRSLGSFVYNLFFRTYPIDPQEIEDEWEKKREINKRPFRNYSPFRRFFSTTGQAGLIYAVCDYYKSRIFRIIVILLTVVELICAIEAWKYNKRINEEIIEDDTLLGNFAKSIDGSLDFYWIIVGGYFGWIKRNSFCLLAFLPYTISILMLSTEEFDKNPNIQIGFNNYMTVAHILLMTEAILYNLSE